ncbi:MAG: hypothetical protein QXV75_08480 [Candidatus Bathyarchaeia archaeon]
MPIGVEAEAEQAYEEGRSVLASLITRLLAIVHRIIDHIIHVARQIMTYASEHPLAMILLTANIMVWVTPT